MEFLNTTSIGNYDFRRLFKRLIVINRDRLIFVVGFDDMNKIPLNPNKISMLFIEIYKYKLRVTYFTTSFGTYINN